ncbi:MAG TPA: YicC/YloC family endoribonuclease [Burkholderiales bacterium]|nr:YicC/YloC family endoribonuclease [Burkholderiales bacterium]
MIFSMTGYAVAAGELSFGGMNVELRAVNHRYLDLQFRLPDDLRLLESVLRERLTGRIARGKVECRVAFNRLPTAQNGLHLNEELLAQLTQLDVTVRATLPAAEPLSVSDALRWPGMLGNDSLPAEELQECCIQLLDKALEDFNGARGREGEKLKAVLLERIAAMEEIVNSVAPRIPQLVIAYQEKLVARLKEALLDPESERLKQEITLFASKIDVDEELSRLLTHLAEIRRILDKGGAVGKRLDFLMQELNREANTLGSKSVDMEVTQGAMGLKVLIEQMREQIQNIE